MNITMDKRQMLKEALTGDSGAIDKLRCITPPTHAVLQKAVPDGYRPKPTDKVSLYGSGLCLTVAEWESMNAHTSSPAILSTVPDDAANFIHVKRFTND